MIYEQEGYFNQLRNRLYALLCEREQEGEWQKFLDNLIIEVFGWSEELKTINYYQFFYKLSSLKYLSYEYFRRTIFDCMNIVSKIEKR